MSGINQPNASCGTVTSTDFSPPGGPFRQRRASYFSAGGDSGGSVYVPQGSDNPDGHVQGPVTAAGIHRGSVEDATRQRLGAYYSHIAEVQDALGVDLVTTRLPLNIRSEHSGKCVDLQYLSSNNGVPIDQWDCGWLDYQSFQLEPVLHKSTYIVRLLYSFKCLDVAGPSVANGAKVQQWDCVYVTTKSGDCFAPPASRVPVAEFSCNPSSAENAST